MTQRSLGEENVTINGTRIGLIRVQAAYAYAAAFPGLVLRLGANLRVPTEQYIQAGTLEGLQLCDVRGELRFANSGEVVGFIQRSGAWSRVSANGYEQQIEVVVPLDAHRVMRIEQRRNGGVAEFQLQLWLTLEAASGFIDSQVSAFPFDVPREEWLIILSKWTPSAYQLLEVPVPDIDRERFTSSLAHVEKAKGHLDNGQYDDAVAACRLALDAMYAGLQSAGKAAGIAGALQPQVPKERADHYDELFVALKAVASIAHHVRPAPHQYWRSEAVFAVQTTQHVLALVGSLSQADAS